MTTFEDVPIGSALAALTDPASDAPSFVPDVTGSYRVRMLVDGVDSAVEVYAVPLPATGARIPSFQERLESDEGGNSKGWHEALSVFMRAADPRAGGSGDVIYTPIWAGDRRSHGSTTPLAVSAFELNPDDYNIAGATLSFEFRAVVANGNTPLTTTVRLLNRTDNQVVTSSVLQLVDSTVQNALSATLTVGAGAGDIRAGLSKIYECQVLLNTAPGDPADTIELYSAEVRAIQTIL